MNQILRIHQQVSTGFTKIPCTVADYIGGGGQGEVYRAKLSDKDVALKWYFPNTATKEQRAILDDLIRKGPPTKKFLWPLDVALADDVLGYGYVMPLRHNRYKSIVDLMKRRIEPNFRALATAGFELADSFLNLHSKGLSYRDISFGNVFFDPDTGEVLICDNDNVAIDGMNISNVVGTPRFMAPEIVRGEAHPSKYTDLFSLSVLLFYMFMVHHPLEGRKEKSIKCLDLPAMNKLYGTEPLFIYDPSDNSNEPVPGTHDNAIVFWEIYPEYIKALFIKAFTEGLTDPQDGRVAESVWRSSMIAMRDSIIYCQHCGSENFYDPKRIRNDQCGTCWSCKKELTYPPILEIDGNNLALNYNTKIYPHHLGDLYNFSKMIGEVVQHPKNPALWGIKNHSDRQWKLHKPDGSVMDVSIGQSASITIGNQIDFGNAVGLVKSAI